MSELIETTAAYKAAEVYEEFIVANIFRYWTPVLLERMAPQSGDQVMDVACGTGVVARSVVPLVKPYGKVVGLDINPEMLSVACRKYSDYCEDIEWRRGRAEKLPFPDMSYDMVICQQGLQFFDDRPMAAREMNRVLRPNGKVGIEVWQSPGHNPVYQNLFTAMAEVFNVPEEDLAKAFSYGSAQELENLLLDAGFHKVEVEPVRHEVHFSDPGRFVELMIRGASAVIPAYASLEAGMFSDLLSRVKQKLEAVLSEYTTYGVLTFPMNANIATAIG